MLEAGQSRLGKEHPYTILALVSLVEKCGLRKFDEAEKLVRLGLSIAELNDNKYHIRILLG